MTKNNTSESIKKEIKALLDNLCVNLGFCLPPMECNRIASIENLNADQFATLVFRAEGMKPEENLSLFRKVRNQFTNRFGKELDPSWRPDRFLPDFRE